MRRYYGPAGLPSKKAPCRACGALTGGAGDSLCVPCWRAVPDDAKDDYVRIWRAFQADTATARDVQRAMARCVDAARKARRAVA